MRKTPILRLIALFTLLIGISTGFSAHGNDRREGAAASQLLNVAQVGIGAADLARNVPACGSQDYMACALIVLDIASIVAGIAAFGANGDAKEAVENEPMEAGELGEAGGAAGSAGGVGGYDVPGYDFESDDLGGFNSSFCEGEEASAIYCQSCTSKPDDPTCKELTLPEALVPALNNYAAGLENGIIEPPDGMTKDEALQEAMDNFSDLNSLVAAANDAALNDDLSEDGEGDGEKRTIANADSDSESSSTKKAKIKPFKVGNIFGDLFKKAVPPKAPAPVNIFGLDLVDAKTGKKLTIFQRGTRRYQGTESYARAFTLGKLEAMRQHALAQQKKSRGKTASRAPAGKKVAVSKSKKTKIRSPRH